MDLYTIADLELSGDGRMCSDTYNCRCCFDCSGNMPKAKSIPVPPVFRETYPDNPIDYSADPENEEELIYCFKATLFEGAPMRNFYDGMMAEYGDLIRDVLANRTSPCVMRFEMKPEVNYETVLKVMKTARESFFVSEQSGLSHV